ncbi:hypothetical protein BC567DRAFT_5361 [Phyllosticta citribraziliensis]
MGTRTKRGSLHASNLSHLACLPHRAVSAPRPRATTNDDETPLPTNPTNELPLAANLDSNTPSRANHEANDRPTNETSKPQTTPSERNSSSFQHFNTTSPALCLTADPRPLLLPPPPPSSAPPPPSPVNCRRSFMHKVSAARRLPHRPPAVTPTTLYRRFDVKTGFDARSRALLDFPPAPAFLSSMSKRVHHFRSHIRQVVSTTLPVSPPFPLSPNAHTLPDTPCTWPEFLLYPPVVSPLTAVRVSSSCSHCCHDLPSRRPSTQRPYCGYTQPRRVYTTDEVHLVVIDLDDDRMQQSKMDLFQSVRRRGCRDGRMDGYSLADHQSPYPASASVRQVARHPFLLRSMDMWSGQDSFSTFSRPFSFLTFSSKSCAYCLFSPHRLISCLLLVAHCFFSTFDSPTIDLAGWRSPAASGSAVL